MMISHGAALESLPALEHVLDPELAQAMIARLLVRDGRTAGWRCVPQYVRFKASKGCLVGHRLMRTDGAGASAFRWVTLFALPPARASELYAKLGTLAPRGDDELHGLAIDAERGLVLLAFPNDRVLRGLKRLLQTGTLKRAVGATLGAAVLGDGTLGGRGSEFRVVRYKPERRCVVQYAAVIKRPLVAERRPLDLYLRVLEPQRFAALVPARLAIQAQAPRALRVPRLLGHDPELSLLVEEDLGAMSTPADVPIEQVGELLGLLHRLAVPPSLCMREASVLPRLVQACVDLAELDEQLGKHAGEVLARLRDQEPGPGRQVLLHGDFSASQVWSGGGEVALLDLDRVRPGRCEEDLAWWAAQDHVLRLGRDPAAGDQDDALARLLSGYRTHAACDASNLSWFRAAALLELAMAPFRRFDPAFADQGHHVLDAASRLLAPARLPGRPRSPWPEALFGELSRLLQEPVKSLEHRGVARLRHGEGLAFLYRTTAATPIAMLRGAEPRFGTPLMSIPCTLVDPRRDAALPGLGALLGPERAAVLARLGLSDAAQGVRLQSYRPTRRAALRVEAQGTIAFLKAHERSRCAQVLARARAIEAAAARAAVALTAPILAVDVEQGLIAHARAAGESMHAMLFDGTPLPLAAVARALQQLHALRVSELPEHRPTDEIAAVTKALELCHHLHPERAAALAQLLAGIALPEPGGSAVLHRDLHDKQIFLDSHTVTFIDLETAARGDRELDIANLAEHLLLRGMQLHQLERGAQLCSTWLGCFADAEPARVRFYRACTAIRLCAVYALREAEPALVQALFERARSLARGDR